MFNYICIVFVGFLTTTKTTTLAQSVPIVQTSYGSIQGVIDTEGSVTITKFLGIPYAKPPVGNLRFKKPEKPEPWNGTLNATEYGSVCYQMNPWTKQVMGSEDCLFLNVFIPGTVVEAMTNPKAVMVYIHGGGWVAGSSNVNQGDRLAMAENVIVVTINYRLGLLGFMSTEDGSIPGNMGLFDQHMALVWVKENIPVFGGGPPKITIFGQSAGANSVLNHYVSPLSKDLFTRAIIMSTPTIRRFINKAEQYRLIRTLASPKCGEEKNTQEFIQCLQELPVYDVMSMAAGGNSYSYVVIDGEFLTDFPRRIIAAGNFDAKKELIVGYTSDDGTLPLGFAKDLKSLYQTGSNNAEARKFSSMIVPQFLREQPIPNMELMGNLVYQKYFSCSENPFDYARKLLDLYTDGWFMSKTFEIAMGVAMHGGTVYVYEFRHLLNALKIRQNAGFEINAGHEQEIGFLFGTTYLDQEKQTAGSVSPSENMLSLSIMKAFAEFAWTGKPVFLSQAGVSSWMPFKLTDMQYVLFDVPMVQNSSQPVPETNRNTAAFWNKVLPEIQSMKTCDPYRSGFNDSSPTRPNEGATFRSSNLFILLAMISFIQLLE